MCFHIFSREGQITVDYVSEVIGFNANGFSEIVIDIIITNESPDALTKIEFLYPRAFVDMEPKSDQAAVFTKAFKDISQSIIMDSNLNWNYNVGLYSLKKTPLSKDFSYQLNFEFPSFEVPYVRSKDSPLTCEVHDIDPSSNKTANKITFSEEYKESKHQCTFIRILSQINFSILTYEFHTPVSSGDRRFCRLKIGPYPGMLCTKNVVKETLKRLTFCSEFSYEIASPYDVLHRFVGRVNSYIQTRPKKLYEPKVLKEINDFIETVRISPTCYKRWKLEIFPKSFGLLHDIALVGKVDPLGVFPNENNELFEQKCPITQNPKSIADKIHNLINKLRLGFYSDFCSTYRSYRFVTKPRSVSWIPKHIELLDKLHGFRLYFSAKPNSYLLRAFYFGAIFFLFYIIIAKPLITEFLEWIATSLDWMSWLSNLAHSPVFHIFLAVSVPILEIAVNQFKKSRMIKKIQEKRNVTRIHKNIERDN